MHFRDVYGMVLPYSPLSPQNHNFCVLTLKVNKTITESLTHVSIKLNFSIIASTYSQAQITLPLGVFPTAMCPGLLELWYHHGGHLFQIHSTTQPCFLPPALALCI